MDGISRYLVAFFKAVHECLYVSLLGKALFPGQEALMHEDEIRAF